MFKSVTPHAVFQNIEDLRKRCCPTVMLPKKVTNATDTEKKPTMSPNRFTKSIARTMPTTGTARIAAIIGPAQGSNSSRGFFDRIGLTPSISLRSREAGTIQTPELIVTHQGNT